ncbi:cytochrome o ubiquinol oxidase subunit IV [Variovorax robiniae]|uniref:Cytochrome bo(3) ubiquinol oxidase subunit 4 n=1 Tax=Variovorax robiniae TaxID=1836199 RepID=A0ABU8X054_9BURK
MSDHNHAHDGHGHDDHGHHGEVPHSTLSGYLKGFFLSVILTAIPFWLVMGKVFDKQSTTILIILALGIVQIFVHMIYFLHMNTKVEGGWSMTALAFTLILVVITLTGSIWVMFHLNHNMMPMSPHEMKNMP